MTAERELAAFFDRVAAEGVMGEFAPDEVRALEVQLGWWNLRPGQRVLEAGCGSGRLSELVAGRIAPGGRLLALDISLGMLRRARPRCVGAGAGLAAASALRLPVPDATFHTVLWFQVFPHMDRPRTALAEARRVLVPGGTLWISHLIPRREVNELHRGLGPEVRDHLIPPDPEVRALLESEGFHVLRLGDTPHGWVAEARREAVSSPPPAA